MRLFGLVVSVHHWRESSKSEWRESFSHLMSGSKEPALEMARNITLNGLPMFTSLALCPKGFLTSPNNQLRINPLHAGACQRCFKHKPWQTIHSHLKTSYNLSSYLCLLKSHSAIFSKFSYIGVLYISSDLSPSSSYAWYYKLLL